MKILHSVRSVQKLTSQIRSEGKVIGFVPTMGYLHEGHLSLMRTARKKCNYLFVSIFVNPTQFGPNEDFSKYPRDFRRDRLLCEKEKVDFIFFPDSEKMYPENYSTYVEVHNITEILEGSHRPRHFRGVATIVLKLFNIIQPDFAVFGQKDAQQVAVIRKMVSDLNVNTKIIVNPTVREEDGLAMSSRNVYLNGKQRKDASVLYKALKYAERKILTPGYNRDLGFIKEQMGKLIKSRPTVTGVDYISFNREDNLQEVTSLKNFKKGRLLISLAVRFGKIRLIDNIVVSVNL
ncbi:MAG: pantoate--beta-alanine ligase [Ignavibacteria bacterium]|nr:pantoate--beta-alanine ligase [Ignavibacteria bacterium]